MTRVPLLLVAHPGHEVLLYGWLREHRPVVCVLTDGSGHSAGSRLHRTRDLLQTLEAREGGIFGRFTDREVYAALLAGNIMAIAELVPELAEVITRLGVTEVVTDAMEGFNPVHDLCRMLAGAACELAGVTTRYEYPVDLGPRGYDQRPEALLTDLDDAVWRRKVALGREMSSVIPDILDMLEKWGEEPFRREAFLPIGDWTAAGWPEGTLPLYEQIGQERVAAGRYSSVIRYRDHLLPVLHAVRNTITRCVS